MMAEVRALLAAGDKKGAARVASTFAQLQRVQNTSCPPRETRLFTGAHSKHDDKHPADVRELIQAHGMRTIEWIVGQRAKDEAIRFTREDWLPRLERWLAEMEPEAETEKGRVAQRYWRGYLTREIKRLRRCLDITQSPDEVRAQTRERVRRLRSKRQREAIHDR